MSWEIISVYSDKGRSMAYVKCACGILSHRRLDHVKSGRTTCCKPCSAKETLKKFPSKTFAKRFHKGVGEITLTFWKTIREGATRRGLDFDISIEYAWQLFLAQGRQCALSGVEITFSNSLKKCNPDYSKFTASLDRIDSSQGYKEGNVQWVHKKINRMKGELTDREFIHWCREVAKFA